jgi:large subunit ribosomal protein L6
MSRIGKLSINVPSGVEVICNGSDITVKGKFGTLQNTIPSVLKIEENEGTLNEIAQDKTRNTSALHG